MRKQHFENLLGKPPKVTHEPITKSLSNQLEIKIGEYTQEKPDSVQREIRNRKAAGIPTEIWKIRQFDDILLRHYNALYNQNKIYIWTKVCFLSFPKKHDLGIAKNYRGITITSIAAKIYNALLRNRIEPKIEKILRKNPNSFRGNPQHHKFWLCIEFWKVYVQKELKEQYYLSTSPRPLTPYTEGRWSKYYSPTAYPKKPSQP